MQSKYMKSARSRLCFWGGWAVRYAALKLSNLRAVTLVPHSKVSSYTNGQKYLFVFFVALLQSASSSNLRIAWPPPVISSIADSGGCADEPGWIICLARQLCVLHLGLLLFALARSVLQSCRILRRLTWERGEGLARSSPRLLLSQTGGPPSSSPLPPLRTRACEAVHWPRCW